MNKWQQRLGNWLTDHLHLPSDTILNLPRITTIGQFHAYIENHRGLLIFKDEEIQLKTMQGVVVITGSDFVIKTLLPEEILIEGTISAIRFIENKNNEQ